MMIIRKSKIEKLVYSIGRKSFEKSQYCLFSKRRAWSFI